MNNVFIRRGMEQLPGISGMEDLLDGKNVVIQPLPVERGGGLFNSAVMHAGLLSDSDLKQHGAGRMVRKSSEKQARWLIDAAATSWAKFTERGESGETGIFVGFDVLDCDDEVEECLAFGGDLSDYANRVLGDTKPLNGLTLLNSTAISHIAELLDITGVSGGFSTSADAGLQALIEGAYNIEEQRCRRALVLAGSAKINPWYLLRIRDQVSRWQHRGIQLTEAAGAVLVTTDERDANARLLACRRSFAAGAEGFYRNLDDFLSSVTRRQLPLPGQVIIAGGSLWETDLSEVLPNFIPDVRLCDLDKLIGYTGPAAGVLSINLGLLLLESGQGLDNREMLALSANMRSPVMVVACGAGGQVCYSVLGGING